MCTGDDGDIVDKLDGDPDGDVVEKTDGIKVGDEVGDVVGLQSVVSVSWGLSLLGPDPLSETVSPLCAL